MEGYKIRKRPRLRNAYLVCGWPGMGEVAFRAANYLVEKLKAEEFAEIEAGEFFYLTGSSIKTGVLSAPDLPRGKFYYWKNKAGKNDIVVFISSAQPDLSKAEAYSRRITHIARLFNIKTIVSFAAMPQPIDHSQPPKVWVTSTSAALNNNLKNYNLSILSEGQISGMNGLFLGLAKNEGFEGFCLLGEIPLYTIQIENPKSSYAVLEAFARIAKLNIDLSELLSQAHIMETEINKLMDYLKIGNPLGPIDENDVEKIKKSLSQLTKLPSSIKDKIEQLFKEARSDIGRAKELKVQLDSWNVYKEYEDRFLDLFKRGNEKGN
ncbi:MAG: PAC2 family protein [Candidatus Omnitrophota bacterium]